MNKSFLTLILISTLFTSLTGVAYAQSPSPAQRPAQVRNQEIREAQKEYREERKDTRTERRATISAARQTFRSERAKNHAERIERRFNWYAERLEAIATRIQTRIDTEKAAGKDVAKAQTSLNSGKATLATAVSDGQKAVDLFATITVDTWDVQKPEVKAAIDAAQKARKGFVTARQQMMDAVKSLSTN